jgi:hypothetical protein
MDVIYLFQEVRRYLTNDNSTAPYRVYALSTASLNDILSQFSELSIVKVVIGYIFMVSSRMTDETLDCLLILFQNVNR